MINFNLKHCKLLFNQLQPVIIQLHKQQSLNRKSLCEQMYHNSVLPCVSNNDNNGSHRSTSPFFIPSERPTVGK